VRTDELTFSFSTFRSLFQVSIKEAKDGLDFFYVQRSHAIKMCEFLAAVTPVRYVFLSLFLFPSVRLFASRFDFR